MAVEQVGCSRKTHHDWTKTSQTFQQKALEERQSLWPPQSIPVCSGSMLDQDPNHLPAQMEAVSSGLILHELWGHTRLSRGNGIPACWPLKQAQATTPRSGLCLVSIQAADEGIEGSPVKKDLWVLMDENWTSTSNVQSQP